MDSNPVCDFVDHQIARYRNYAGYFRFAFLLLRSSQLGLAASIPVVALISPSHSQPFLNGVLGSLIVAIEGLQHTFRLQTYWVRHRSAQHALVRERLLYVGNAGPYAKLSQEEATRLLAERVEAQLKERQQSWDEITEGLGSEKITTRGKSN